MKLNSSKLPIDRYVYERGGATCPDFGQVCAQAEPKSRPITRAKFFIEKPPKAYENDMNLLIFLDLTYNPCKNVKFCSLQGKNVKFFLIFTYNQGKIFLILPITRGATCIPSPHWELPPPLVCIFAEVSYAVDREGKI